MNIPLSRPIIGPGERRAVDQVLQSGLLASGARVQLFESAFAALCGVEHAVAVGSGTAALHVGLLASGIGPGDEVIVPSFTFAASANSVRMCGATPVFVDVDPHTFCINAASVAAAITKRTVGVMPVHLYGHPAPMGELSELADREGIAIFEDAAQAHVAEWEGKRVGSWGTFAAFSFYPTKNMTTGEGGMITTSSEVVADRARLIRNQGMRARYEHELVGINERMTEIEAAIGLVQLEKLDDWTKRRRENAAWYDSQIDHSLNLPIEARGAFHVYHQYTIRPSDRSVVIAALERAGIGYGIYYPKGTHQQGPYLTDDTRLPITEALTEHVLSIPIRPDLTTDELALVARTLNGTVR